MYEDLTKYNKEGTVLRKAQLRLLDMLVEVDRICKKHNIPYWINGGNALGAVRHGGFIPWDDDVDINLLRDDYLKLLPILENELPKQFVLQNKKSEKYFQKSYSRVVDTNSFVDYGEIRCTPRKKFQEQGLFLDIFFVERGNPTIKKFVDFFYVRIVFNLTPASESIPKRVCAVIGWPFVRFLVAVLRVVKFIFPKNNYVFGYGIPFTEQFRLDELLPTKPIIYEEKSVMGPNIITSYLERYFGKNYMEIPPVDKRKTHAEKIEIYDVN